MTHIQLILEWCKFIDLIDFLYFHLALGMCVMVKLSKFDELELLLIVFMMHVDLHFHVNGGIKIDYLLEVQIEACPHIWKHKNIVKK